MVFSLNSIWSVIIEHRGLIGDLTCVLLVFGPPGAGEQDREPAGDVRGSEERGSPEAAGSQVFARAVVH